MFGFFSHFPIDCPSIINARVCQFQFCQKMVRQPFDLFTHFKNAVLIYVNSEPRGQFGFTTPENDCVIFRYIYIFKICRCCCNDEMFGLNITHFFQICQHRSQIDSCVGRCQYWGKHLPLKSLGTIRFITVHGTFSLCQCFPQQESAVVISATNSHYGGIRFSGKLLP